MALSHLLQLVQMKGFRVTVTPCMSVLRFCPVLRARLTLPGADQIAVPSDPGLSRGCQKHFLCGDQNGLDACRSHQEALADRMQISSGMKTPPARDQHMYGCGSHGWTMAAGPSQIPSCGTVWHRVHCQV